MTGGRLSLVYFTNALARGGAEEHILTLLRGLSRRSFQLHLVCPPVLADMLRPDVPDDVEIVPLLLRKPTQVGAALRLARVLRDRRVDILHSHLFYSGLFASPVGRLCRVPLIVETPHLRELWRTSGLKSFFVVDRMVGRCTDHYIAVSEANARYLIAEKRLPSRKVVVIHNGCDVERFDPARAAPPRLKAELGFEADDPVVLVLGRLEPQKGHSVLLDALPLILREFPRTRLVCAGDGALRRDLEDKMRELGLADAVRFVGFQADVMPWLALADITVLPSLYEGLPLVAIESLAAGRAMVATAVDGTPEVVVDGKTGLLVPAGEPKPLAEAICRLLGAPDERRRLGLAGRQWVIERFDRRLQVSRTEELYLGALARRGRAPMVTTEQPLVTESRVER